MTDDWDFYALKVDGEPASIFVDLGIQAKAPLASHPIMAYIRLHMRNPRPDGLSSREEFDTLIDIEKQIEATLCGEDVGFVGRNTSGGCRDFYFYTSDLHDWRARVDRALSRFEDYNYETGAREDAAWSTYFGFLLPGKIDRQRIENRRVCEALERHGDSLTAKREIDHWSFFPTQQAVDAYLAEVSAEGFQLRGLPVSEDGPLRFGAQVWRVDVPTYANIDEITLPLYEAAERHGGEYDGWESPVEARRTPRSIQPGYSPD
jgi:regulator of RNase E activity RraB